VHVVEAEVYQTPKRRRIDTTEVFTETDDVVDYRPTQDELMAVDDFMVLNNVIDGQHRQRFDSRTDN
jgi:hypothetical protein